MNISQLVILEKWCGLVCDKCPGRTCRIDIDVCYPHKADIRRVVAKCPLMTQSGHLLNIHISNFSLNIFPLFVSHERRWLNHSLPLYKGCEGNRKFKSNLPSLTKTGPLWYQNAYCQFAYTTQHQNRNRRQVGEHILCYEHGGKFFAERNRSNPWFLW